MRKLAGAAAACCLAVTAYGVIYFPAVDLGLPFGYYGKVNRILGRLAACPTVEVTFVARHEDLTLEDFWVTVRDASGAEVVLDFSNANIRPFAELAEELARVGCE